MDENKGGGVLIKLKNKSNFVILIDMPDYNEITNNLPNCNKSSLIDICILFNIKHSKSWTISKIVGSINAYITNITDNVPLVEMEVFDSKTSDYNCNTYSTLFTYLNEKKFNESEFKHYMNDGDIEKGFKQEAIAVLVIFTKVIDMFNTYDAYCPHAFSQGVLKKITSIDKYFNTENIRKGGSKVDIVLIDDETKTILAFSSKNMNADIGNFDIADIRDVFNTYYKNDINSTDLLKKYNLKIGIICPDEQLLNEKIEKCKSTSNHLKKIDVIVDQAKLWCSWNILINKHPDLKDLDTYILGINNTFQLRFGQKVICDQVAYKIQNGATCILNGSECRFGKSFCMAQDILSAKKNVILVLTSQPKTISSIEGVFRKYNEFKPYKIYNLNTNFGKTEAKSFNEEKDISKKIILVSIQTLRGVLCRKLKLNNIDMVIIDEFHESGDTENTNKVFDDFKLNECLRIFYTATYSKVKLFYRIPTENIFVWNQEDNYLAARISDTNNISKLQEKHATVNIKNILKFYHINDIMDHYKNIPTLYFIVSKPSDKCISEFKEINSIEETKNHGYSWKSVSILNDHGELKTPDAVIDYFRTFFGAMLETVGARRYESPQSYTMKTYFNLCNNVKQRTSINSKPLIIPIYMGQVFKEGSIQKDTITDSIIDNVSHKVKDLLIKEYKKFIVNISNYAIIIYNSKTNDITIGNESLEDGFDRLVNTTYANKTGILLLLGSALHTGITNKYCDLIKLNCDIKSYDRFYQTVSRARNESVEKTHAFIIVDNYQGMGCILDMIPYYKLKGESSRETFIRIIKQKLINITEVESKDITTVEFSEIDTIYTKLKSTRNVTEDFDRLIENIHFNFDNIQYSSILRCIFAGTLNKTTERILNTVDGLLKGQIGGIKDGTEETKVLDSKTSDSKTSEHNTDKKTNDEKKKIDQFKEEAMQEAVKHLTLLLALFSVNWNGKSWIDLLDWVKKEEIMEGFTVCSLIKQQLKISFPKLEGETNNIANVDMVWNITETFMSMEYHRDEIEHIIIEIKETFRSRIGHIRDLYIQIEQVIKPTDEARRGNAEILTPLKLAEEMTNKIPDEFWREKKTVFEPTCGKGVFLCLAYEKFLRAGLDKKTILEECLYFADLNPVNVYICKFLLDPLNEYKLNYYIGDTLTLNIETEFKINKFDLVIGNPPYNDASGNGGVGHCIWTKFVEKSLNTWVKQNGYLVFVHPALWRDYNHKLLASMKTKQIIYLEIHDEKDGKKIFNAGTRYDWYVLKNTQVTKKTIILGDDGIIYKINISKLSFIPNRNFTIINNLIMSPKCEIIMERSPYGADKKHMSTIQSDEFKYPCVYSVNKADIPKFKYSKINTNGHFNIPKVIFTVGYGTGFLSDPDGMYGLTQWCAGIIAKPTDHVNIIKYLKSDGFNEIRKSISVSLVYINPKILKEFKKDFWNDFI